jgi:hypothetical protein
MKPINVCFRGNNGPQRTADLGNAHRSGRNGVVDRRAPDAEASADQRSDVGRSSVAAARKQNPPLALGQNSEFEKRKHRVPLGWCL